ncbi:phosphate ABC transporter substrate-binding protein PstS [Myceligenerans crystallogenes]|uniref:Phosphate-binding protein n=1 Tax=Myceligenerans crystallogenes TaxID=316335 RepID=A0ABN2N9W8_9MICO
MKLSRFTRAGSAAMVGALALTLAACGTDPNTGGGSDETGEATEGSSLSGTLSGGGASSQEAAMEAWRAGFQSLNPEVTVDYDPTGSGTGREQFIAGAFPFIGTDSALDEDEMKAAEETCGSDIIEYPGYISPVAVAFNLEGVESVNMSPETIAKIFKGDITKWNDEAIAAENEGVELPDTDITVVHRSDPSGTTENFVEYMSTVTPDVWDFEVEDVWPVKGQDSAQGTSGVVSTATSTDGAITYADASQIGELGTVAVGVGDEFVPYSAEAAAAVVSKSPRVEGTAETVWEYDLKRDIAGTYPIVLVSYHVACATYEDAATADLVKGLYSYILSDEGQAQGTETAGSAPVEKALRDEYLGAVETISAAG